MTMPRAMKGATLDTVPVGRPLGRSWLLLFGFLPVEYDHICIERLEPFAFQEDSTMLTLRRWRHRRELIETPEGTLVTDTLEWTPRLPGMNWLVRRITAALFRHRHRRLIARYGGAPCDT